MLLAESNVQYIDILDQVSVNERNELISTGVLSGSPTASLLSATSLFVWDEAPMANRAVLSCVDEALQLATSVDSPFGGKTIVLLGDFRQNCPVVQHGTRQDVVDASIRYAPLWTTFRIFHLHAPIRNATDLQFSLWVDAIGNGLMKMPSLDMLNKLISIDDVIEWTFPEAILADPVSAARRSILAVTNQQIEYYNLRVLRHIHGEERTYYATDSVKDLDDNQIGVANSTRLFPSSADENSDTLDPHDMLSIFTKYTPPGCPPWALTVKEGAVYRLLRNFSISKGLVKNARVLVRKVGRHIVTVALIVQDQEGSQDLLIPRINFEATMPKCAYAMLRLQFPLAPAYATTFNSCQGLTLDRVAVDLTTSAFSHGQLYTALSRVRQRDHCAVRLPGSATCTQNVTYTELLI
jgi:ATP-dependent DNA helicase PIF1